MRLLQDQSGTLASDGKTFHIKYDSDASLCENVTPTTTSRNSFKKFLF